MVQFDGPFHKHHYKAHTQHYYKSITKFQWVVTPHMTPSFQTYKSQCRGSTI